MLISHKWPPVIVTSFEICRIVWPQMIGRILLLEEVAAIFVLVGSTKILKQWLIFHFLDNFVQCFVGVHDFGFFLIWLQTTKSQEFGKWSVKLSIFLMIKLFCWGSSFDINWVTGFAEQNFPKTENFTLFWFLSLLAS